MRIRRTPLTWIALATVAAVSASLPLACSTDFTTVGETSGVDARVQIDAIVVDGTLPILTADSGSIDSDTPTDASIDVVMKRVFVSHETFAGGSDFDEAGAGVCQALAKDAGLGGTWVVWHSDTSNNVNAIDLVGDASFVLVDNETLVATRAQLLSPPLAHAIDHDQRFAAVTGSVWTGTASTGLASGMACNGWSSSVNTTPGTQGDTITAEAGWTDESTGTCDEVLHVYCFEK